jgi:hypothetical protein
VYYVFLLSSLDEICCPSGYFQNAGAFEISPSLKIVISGGLSLDEAAAAQHLENILERPRSVLWLRPTQDEIYVDQSEPSTSQQDEICSKEQH